MRKSFIVHNDSLAVLEDLTLEQCGELFQAIKSYQLGEDLELSPIVKIAFSPFKNQFARDEIKYQNIVDRNRNNGLKGGRPKNPEEPTGISGNPVKPKKADSVSKSKSDSKNDSDSKRLVIPDGINQPAWIEWIEYRKSKKKTVSPAAAKKQFKLLSNYAFDVQQQIIDQSIQNDYQGLFEPKGNTNGQNQSGGNPAANRLTPTQRVEAKRDEAAQRRRNVESMGDDDQTIPPRMDQPGGGGADGHMGETIDGTFTRTS
jgi:hypothetical protein